MPEGKGYLNDKVKMGNTSKIIDEMKAGMPSMEGLGMKKKKGMMK